jgi:uncharacterized phage protein (TIGR02220 family)
MTSSTGWISLHRQIQDHWLWTDKPFSKQAAWIDMLLLANHADNKFLFGNELIEVKSGSFITSELKLMERWGWSKSKTRSFLDLLQKDGMIVKKSDRKKTAITIVKYSDFQGLQTTKRPQKDHKKTTGRPLADTNNNDNNDNNENKYIIIVEFLNQKAGTKYKASSKKTKACIHARLSEGFTVDDFKTVIEKKCAEWIGTEWEKFIRPETLFGTKFESYLNAKVTKTTKQVNTGVPSGDEQNDLDELF